MRITSIIIIIVTWCALVAPAAAQPASSVWGTVGMSGLYGMLSDLAVYDDGTGPALYLCGYRNGEGHGVWRWDGSAWTNVGLASSWCYALEVYDDGTGSRLYVSGSFSSVAGVPASRIASWDGAAWSALGSGFSGGSGGTKVYALTVFDDGAGPALFAGGAFTSAGGVASAAVARWDGVAWSAPIVASPLDYLSIIRAFTIHDDGTGPALYCGGYVAAFIAGNPNSSVLRYDGTAWSTLGQGFTIGGMNIGTIHALASFDEGSGPRLFAGGRYTAAWGCPLASLSLARWDGSCWTAVGGGIGGDNDCTITGLEVFDDGTGPALYIAGGGGHFSWAGSSSYTVNDVVRWRNGAYEALVTGLQSGLPAAPIKTCFQPFDDGSGLDLYVAGNFGFAGSVPTGPVARFGGRSPTIQLSQPAGPGTGVLITNDDFMPGREYYNLFSLEPCPGGPGTGPYVGLCASNVQTLFDQFNLPVGLPPFHFLGTARTMTHGPFLLPPGLTFDCVCFDWTNSQPVAISPVDRYTIL